MQTIQPQAALSDESERYFEPSSRPKPRSKTLTPLQRHNRRPVVVLSSHQLFPFWLKILIGLKQGVALSLLLAVVGVLGVYTWMADAQRQWGQNYHQLKELERKERQLLGANERLKEHFVEAQHSDSTVINPTTAIFLKPSAIRPKVWVDTQDIKRLSPPASY